jgi:hypothetical protein
MLGHGDVIGMPAEHMQLASSNPHGTTCTKLMLHTSTPPGRAMQATL